MQQEFEVKHGQRKDQLRQTYQVNVENRFQFLDTSTAPSYEPFIYSFCHVQRAFVLRHREGTSIALAHTPSGQDGIPNVLVWEMALGNGSPYPTQTGSFEVRVDDVPAARIAIAKSARVWGLNGFRLAFHVSKLKIADPGGALFLDPQIAGDSWAAVGLAALVLPADRVPCGRPTRITVRPIGEAKSENWVRVGQTPDGLAFIDAEPVVRLAMNGLERPERLGRKLFFGDIHAHSGDSHLLGWGCGEGTRRSNLEFARDTALLDFCSLTEHDWQMNTRDWEELQGINDEFDHSGAFVTLHSYEWTSCNYGHRNIYFRERGAPLFRSSLDEVGYGTWRVDNPTPTDLWRYLEEIGVDSITAPHHPSVALFPVDPSIHFNDKYDRFIEVYSSWGSSEAGSRPTFDDISLVADRFTNHGVIDFLEAGHHFGLVASSDSHDGRPGQAQGTDRRPQLYHYLGSGRTVVLAESLERDGIFNALKARRAYATTGEPIELGFSYGDRIMGQRCTRSAAPFLISARGTQPITRVDVVKNGQVVFSEAPSNHEFAAEWTDSAQSGRTTDYYYVCVRQSDGERAWSSPIWVASS